ncbi:argininosuccinate lyase [Clostridium sporogenes]|uniref:hypothetical protein n=1 Tax=Clostridium TaxID=1485 RepID=UPI0005F96563|nr:MULTISPECIES: hypothetical protein [Clostridium]MDI6919854.1 hypothetical protein [Clostridium botulinum]NFV12521.1 argininosuccinate lyase [Clostridium sporogenes]WMU97224.1 hypothetical protein QA656_15860 [Clostridium botulinum]
MSSLGLQLPNNYVEIEGTEMEYIDGGKKSWYNSTNFIGTAIDVGVIAISGGTSIFSTVAARKFIKQYRGQLTRVARNVLLKYVGTASAGAISSAIDIALTVGGTSIGGMIAEGLDRADGKNDGYVFG